MAIKTRTRKAARPMGKMKKRKKSDPLSVAAAKVVARAKAAKKKGMLTVAQSRRLTEALLNATGD